MIAEELLRQAAREAGAAILDSLPAETECSHTFSLAFEQKMDRLLRRTDHPVARTVLTRAAGFLLALLLSGTVWLSVDAQAREAFFGWIRQLRDTHFSYFFSGETVETAQPEEYRPTELPNDWTEIDSWTDGSGSTVVYLNDAGQVSYFSVMIPGETVMAVGDSKTQEVVFVNGKPADFYAGVSEKENNTLIWTEGELLFSISAQLSKTKLIHIAESVALTKK